MKKVTTRSFAALLLAALAVVGMGVYVFRLMRNGGKWASFSANQSVYSQDGGLSKGTVLDRYGRTLAFSNGEVYGYAEDPEVRVACLHAVGDMNGSIGTGVLTAFRSTLVGYNPVTGTTGSGGTIQLNIDADLNVTAYEALAGRNGAVLVYNYETGELLCMTSSLSYDPNYGFDSDDSRYDGVFINRGLSASYVPGSVFKLVTLAAAIETGPLLPDLLLRRLPGCGGRHHQLHRQPRHTDRGGGAGKFLQLRLCRHRPGGGRGHHRPLRRQVRPHLRP